MRLFWDAQHPGILLKLSLSLSMASVGCEAHERVVVRDRPAVRVVETRPPVVEEKVIVRP